MSRIKQAASWLGEGSAIWTLCGTIFLWFLLRYSWSNCQEPQLRLLGTFLQLYGIWTVYRGIKDKRTLFPQPGTLSRLTNYFRRFPLRKRQIVIGAMAGAIKLDGGSVRFIVRSGADAPISDRLLRLEANFDGLFNEVGDLSNRLDAESKSTRQRLSAEEEARKHDVEALNWKLEAATAGGLHIDVLGLACVVLGAVIGGLAPELSAWLGDAGCQSVPFRSLWSFLPR